MWLCVLVGVRGKIERYNEDIVGRGRFGYIFFFFFFNDPATTEIYTG